MKPEEMQAALKKHGIDTEIVSVYRNGRQRPGLRVCTGAKVTPVIHFTQDATLPEMLGRIKDVLQRKPEFRTELLESSQFTLENSILCVQKQSDDPILKRTFENLEVFVRIQLPEFNVGDDYEYSIKATEAYIGSLGLAASQVWDAAYRNTRKTLLVREISDVLSSFGLPPQNGSSSFYVAGTKECMNGASAILYPDLFRNLCREKGFRECFILPSSIHELMVIPAEGMDMILPEMAGIVDEINNECVRPEERLEPVVYRYSLESDEIHIAATLTEVTGC